MDRDTVDEIKKEFRQQVGVLTEEFQSRISAVIERQDSLDTKIDGFESRIGREFEETRAMIRLSPRSRGQAWSARVGHDGRQGAPGPSRGPNRLDL